METAGIPARAAIAFSDARRSRWGPRSGRAPRRAWRPRRVARWPRSPARPRVRDVGEERPEGHEQLRARSEHTSGSTRSRSATEGWARRRGRGPRRARRRARTRSRSGASRDPSRRAFDEAHRRPVHLEVVELLGVDRREPSRAPLLAEVADRRVAPSPPSFHPANAQTTTGRSISGRARYSTGLTAPVWPRRARMSHRPFGRPRGISDPPRPRPAAPAPMIGKVRVRTTPSISCSGRSTRLPSSSRLSASARATMSCGPVTMSTATTPSRSPTARETRASLPTCTCRKM